VINDGTNRAITVSQVCYIEGSIHRLSSISKSAKEVWYLREESPPPVIPLGAMGGSWVRENPDIVRLVTECVRILTNPATELSFIDFGELFAPFSANLVRSFVSLSTKSRLVATTSVGSRRKTHTSETQS